MVELPAEAAPPEADAAPGCPHPRMAERVFGHKEAERTLLDAFNSGRMHHAWLIHGAQGIGKATLAWRAARFLLSQEPPGSDALFAPPPSDSLDISPDHPIARRVAALSEPRLFLLRRAWDAKTEKIATRISVDETRRLKGFFQLASDENAMRVVIVDAADEMNAAAANALLKALEEPPERTVMLLISHQPSRLLPTIRSRCRGLRLAALSPEDHQAALTQAGIAHDPALYALSEGSVGVAARLEAAGGPELYANLVALFDTLPRLDRGRAAKLAEAAGARGQDSRFEVTVGLLERLMARLARTGATGAPPPEILPGEAALLSRLAPDIAAGRRWAAQAQELAARARRGRAVNLDPSALILDICLGLDRGG
ncbi:MAG: DNA polymerase III subunit delta' [Pseudomonadota bacterium]